MLPDDDRKDTYSIPVDFFEEWEISSILEGYENKQFGENHSWKNIWILIDGRGVRGRAYNFFAGRSFIVTDEDTFFIGPNEEFYRVLSLKVDRDGPKDDRYIRVEVEELGMSEEIIKVFMRKYREW